MTPKIETNRWGITQAQIDAYLETELRRLNLVLLPDERLELPSFDDMVPAHVHSAVMRIIESRQGLSRIPQDWARLFSLPDGATQKEIYKKAAQIVDPTLKEAYGREEWWNFPPDLVAHAALSIMSRTWQDLENRRVLTKEHPESEKFRLVFQEAVAIGREMIQDYKENRIPYILPPSYWNYQLL